MPTPPLGTFTQVSVAGDQYLDDIYHYYAPGLHACAIRSDQTVACWGDDTVGQSNPKFGTYQQISVARGKSCGLLTDGRLACWGDGYAHSRPPTGSFVKVAASASYACALRADGTVHCWGNAALTPPPDLFSDVYTAHNYACGIRRDSTVTCWGDVGRP